MLRLEVLFVAVVRITEEESAVKDVIGDVPENARVAIHGPASENPRAERLVDRSTENEIDQAGESAEGHPDAILDDRRFKS